VTGPATSWKPIGPAGILHGQTDQIDRGGWGSAPVSGRVTSIAVDPADPDTKVYVGTALGGVWKLVKAPDGSFSWETLIDLESVITVGALALNPAGDVLWVGTGDSALGGDAVVGRGVLRVDLGAGTVIRYYAGGNIVGGVGPPGPSGLPLRTIVTKIVVNPKEALHVVAATTDGVFELTTLAGPWSEVKIQPSGGGGTISMDTSDIVLETGGATNAHHRLWAGHRLSGPVITMREGPPGSGPLVEVADPAGALPGGSTTRVVLGQCETHPEVIYAAVVAPNAAKQDVLTILRTSTAPHGDPAGPPPAGPPSIAWSKVTGPTDPGQLFYNLVLAVHPKLPDTVYFGETRVWRTLAGGAPTAGGASSWEQCGKVTTTSQGIHWDQHALYIDPRFGAAGSYDQIRLWAGNDGGVWRSVDGGTSWGHRNRGLQTLQFFELTSHPTARTILIAGAQDNGVLRSTGSGTWLEISQGDGCYVAIDPDQPHTVYQGYVSYPDPNKRTTDGFQGLARSTSNGDIGTFANVAGPHPALSGTTDSIDPGDDALFYAPFKLVPSGTAGTAGELWIGTDKLYRSGDRGDHWQQVGPRLLNPRPAGAGPSTSKGVSVIAHAPGHGERIYAGTSDGHLWRLDTAAPGNWPTGTLATSRELTVTPAPPAGPPPQPLAAGDGFLSDIAAVRMNGHDRVAVTVGLHHVGAALSALPATPLVYLSEDDGVTFTPLILEDVTFPDGSTLPAAQNSANTVVFDPTDHDVLFIGCDVGVFSYHAGDPKALLWNQGLPNAPVLDLDVWPKTAGPIRLIRAATHGRGIFETELGAAAPHPADVYLRDTVLDDGRDAPTPPAPPDPFTDGKTLSATESPDIKIESAYFFGSSPTRVSTVDYTPAGPLDFIGFEQIAEGTLVGGRASTVHVQVRNRGPAVATNVRVRAFFALKSGAAYPALPSDFWTTFPATDPSGTDWVPLGPALTLATLRPGEPALASWSWDLPGTGSDARILAAVTSAEDGIAAPSLNPDDAGRTSKYVAVRDISTSIPEWEVIALIVIGLGLGGAAIAYAATR